jgi:hypothetical protein
MPDSPLRLTVREATAEHPRHSEPALLERRDGTLVMVWQEYLAPGASGAGAGADDSPSRLSCLESRDGGRTWDGHRVLVTANPGDTNVYSPNLARCPDGAWLFTFLRYNLVKQGKPIEASGYACRSADEGRTWSSPEAMYERKPLRFTSGVLKRLPCGRLLQPAETQSGETWTPTERLLGSPLYSDDGGRSWELGASRLALPMRGVMETHVEVLRDGRLFMVMRNQLGSVFSSVSPDRGATWSKPQTTGLRAPESCPELVRNPRNGDLILVWNHSEYDPGFRSHYGRRSPLTVAFSRDDAKSWQGFRDLETDPRRAFSNPVACVTSRDEVVVMYWVAEYDASWRMVTSRIHLHACIFGLDWLYGA